MNGSTSDAFEDDDFVVVPDYLFQYLPSEYHDEIEEQKCRYLAILGESDREIKNLFRMSKSIFSVASLRYIYSRLTRLRISESTEGIIDLEILTNSFIMTYSRLFVEGNGASGFSRDCIPVHLRGAHDEIIQLRNRRFAHHDDSDETIGSGLQIEFDDAKALVKLELKIGFYFGGRNEWEELLKFLDAQMHERIQKILGRLSEKTGLEWKFESGPVPKWVMEPGATKVES